MGIGSYCNLPTLLLLFSTFKYMCITKLFDETNPTQNAVQLIFSKVLLFHENTELFPSVECYDLYPGDNEPTKHIMDFFAGTPVRNKPDWVELAKVDLS